MRMEAVAVFFQVRICVELELLRWLCMALSPDEIAGRGEKIYQACYQKEFEEKYPGQFVAIDVGSGKAFVDRSPEKAVQKAEGLVDGFLHLIKIGSATVYHLS